MMFGFITFLTFLCISVFGKPKKELHEELGKITDNFIKYQSVKEKFDEELDKLKKKK